MAADRRRNAGTSAAREKAAEEDLPPELRFAALKDKFRDLEERTGGMETLVTSSEFRLRRDFKEMREGQTGRRRTEPALPIRFRSARPAADDGPRRVRVRRLLCFVPGLDVSFQ